MIFRYNYNQDASLRPNGRCPQFRCDSSRRLSLPLPPSLPPSLPTSHPPYLPPSLSLSLPTSLPPSHSPYRHVCQWRGERSARHIPHPLLHWLEATPLTEDSCSLRLCHCLSQTPLTTSHTQLVAFSLCRYSHIIIFR